jgi:hypothetical protein
MTELQLCNMALRRIQAEPITDLQNDVGKSAALLRTFYDEARDALLADHPWSFAVRRQLLAVSSETNLTAYEYMYQLPTDPYCLRALELLDQILYRSAYTYEIEGKYLYSDEYSASLKYIGRIEDVTQFDPLFTDALAWRIAAELIKPIEGTSPVDPWMMYEVVLLRARAVDEQSKVEKQWESPQWIDERFG